MTDKLSPVAIEIHPLDAAAQCLPGGRNELAKLLGVTVAAIGNWKLRGMVPLEHCMPIELAVQGKVTRRVLRPDDWRKHWPELGAVDDQEGCDAPLRRNPAELFGGLIESLPGEAVAQMPGV